MLQNLESDLRRYHDLFQGGRCQGWEQEELIVKAIKSDTAAQHSVKWREGGHDDKNDLEVAVNGSKYELQIKSGKIKTLEHRNILTISGHRLGRFDRDFVQICRYLNANRTNIISVSYEKVEDEFGRHHDYTIRYINADVLTGVIPTGWVKHGKQYRQTSDKGVLFSLRPSMSWQIWWEIPVHLTTESRSFSI